MDDSKLASADLEWAIGINRISLKILGLWPDDRLTRRQKFLANLRSAFICFTMCFAGMIPGFIALTQVYTDFMAVIDNLQIGLPFSVTVMKFIILWFRRDANFAKRQFHPYIFILEALIPMVNMVVEDWTRMKTARERDLMISQARIARMIVVFGATMMSIASIVLIVPPCFGYSMRYVTNLTDPGKPLLLQAYYLRDVTESPYFEIIWVAQAMSIVMGAVSYTGVDTFLGLLLFHVCAQLDILKERVQNLDNFKDFKTGLSFCIRDHLRLIRSVDIIDKTFNLMLLILLVVFAMFFCVQGFLMVTIVDGGGDSIPFWRICWLISILINLFGHMCLYCAVGEILIAKAEAIYYAAYNYKWYYLKANEARDMLMIIVCAERPVYITAGRMFPMTLSLFCNVIKTSAGYMSVLMANR